MVSHLRSFFLSLFYKSCEVIIIRSHFAYRSKVICIAVFMQQLYLKALSIKSAIPHPRIMGIIRECGGKMHMAERQWAEAATDFFEAFKNYDEAGNQRRIQCLKYVWGSLLLVLAFSWVSMTYINCFCKHMNYVFINVHRVFILSKDKK